MTISRRAFLTWAGSTALTSFAPPVFAQGKKGGGPSLSDEFLASGPPIIDTHAHLQALARSGMDWDGGLRTALGNMDRLNIRRTLILPPPQPYGFEAAYDLEFASAVKRNASRFAIVAGGGSLNPMINRRRAETSVSTDVTREFDGVAAKIADAGAVAFGEMTCEHFSGFVGHPYVSAPPDHPLFLRLADIAAERDLPIDLHMETVPADMAMPAPFRERSGFNPEKVAGNIERFERLLAHNRKTRIVWVHLGWDVTGFRTLDLTRALLGRHENLYLQLRPLPPPQPGAANVPLFNFVLTSELKAEPAWSDLMAEYPDRFVLGSDSFYVAPGVDPRVRFAPPLPFVRPFVNSLPPDLGARVAHRNAGMLYKLPAL